jgi:hypothetical protein
MSNVSNAFTLSRSGAQSTQEGEQCQPGDELFGLDPNGDGEQHDVVVPVKQTEGH